MKKNFVKKLAMALSLAMTVSTLAPAASADAAAAPAFKSYKTSVYENGTNNGSYTYTVKNIKKNYTVKWSVTGDGKAYVTPSKASTKATKTTVSNTIKVATNGEAAAKNAKATVTAKVYDTKNKLVKTIKDAVTVKVEAKAVSIYAADNGTSFETAVGEKYDLNRTLTPANSTSKTYWTVADADGNATEDATIDAQGVLTATKAGKYTVTATVRNTKTSKDLATATQDVTVKDAVLKSVSQTTATELAAVFAGATDKVQNTDFVITRTSDNVAFPVSKVVVDNVDKTKVTLTTFSKMVDGKEYSVKYGETTLTFVATDGKVASLVVDPITIPFNEETEIHVLGKDANGISVFDSTMADKEQKLDITIEPTAGQGYVTDGKLALLEKGNTAKVTATLHTYEYNTDGTEKDVLKVEATITAVDPEAVSLTGTRYTVAKTLDWTKAVNTKIAKSDVADMFLFYELKDSKGNVVTEKYAKAKSSDDNVLLVEATGTAGKVSLLPVKEGTAYVLIMDDKDNVVTSFAVTVVADRKATTLSLSSTSIRLSNGLADDAVIKVSLKDQYGEDMKAPDTVDITENSKPSTGSLTVDYSNGEISISSSKDNKEGSYVYEVKSGELSRVFTVIVEKPNKNLTATYKMNLSTSKVNTTIGNTFDGKAVNIVVSAAKYRGTVKDTNVDLNDKITLELFDSKGVKITATGAAIQVNSNGTASIPVIKVSGNAVSGDAIEVEKVLGKGTYTVKATFYKLDDEGNKMAAEDKNKVTVSTSFIVEDEQPGVTYTVKKATTSGSIESAVQDPSVVEFYYNGETVQPSDITFKNSRKIENTNTHAAIEVTVKVTVKADGKEYKVPVTVALTQSITVNQ